MTKKNRVLIVIDNGIVWSVMADADVIVIVKNLDLEVFWFPIVYISKFAKEEIDEAQFLADQLRLSFKEVKALNLSRKKR